MADTTPGSEEFREAFRGCLDDIRDVLNEQEDDIASAGDGAEVRFIEWEQVRVRGEFLYRKKVDGGKKTVEAKIEIEMAGVRKGGKLELKPVEEG